jgi:hypothetical protein
LRDGEWIQQGSIFLARNPRKYPLRFQPFSDALFKKFLKTPYPIDCRVQGLVLSFWDTGLQFLALNSCWETDEFHRKRASIHPDAVAHVLREAQRQETDARQSGKLADHVSAFRIAVWHHAIVGPEQIKNTDFLGQLQNNGVRLALHGDVHELRRDLVAYWQRSKQLHIIGAGSFGASMADRPESTPRLYNLLEIHRDGNRTVVHTRCQPKPNGPWKGWNEWPRTDDLTGGVPYYEIHWVE